MGSLDEERGREGDGNQIKEGREGGRGVEVCGWRGAQDGGGPGAERGGAHRLSPARNASPRGIEVITERVNTPFRRPALSSSGGRYRSIPVGRPSAAPRARRRRALNIAAETPTSASW